MGVLEFVFLIFTSYLYPQNLLVGKEQNKIMSESLENFTNIVKEDIKEAKTLFFSEAFKEEYLKDRREEKELYHQL